jgi:hypothetical protein
MVDALVEQDGVDLGGAWSAKRGARRRSRVWLDVPRQPARAVGLAWAEARPTAGPDRHADGRRYARHVQGRILYCPAFGAQLFAQPIGSGQRDNCLQLLQS